MASGPFFYVPLPCRVNNAQAICSFPQPMLSRKLTVPLPAWREHGSIWNYFSLFRICTFSSSCSITWLRVKILTICNWQFLSLRNYLYITKWTWGKQQCLIIIPRKCLWQKLKYEYMKPEPIYFPNLWREFCQCPLISHMPPTSTCRKYLDSGFH